MAAGQQGLPNQPAVQVGILLTRQSPFLVRRKAQLISCGMIRDRMAARIHEPLSTAACTAAGDSPKSLRDACVNLFGAL